MRILSACLSLWLSPHQVVSPSSLLKTRITGISPKTSSLLNTRIYVSTPCSSTNRSWRRPTILPRASRHRLRTRTWTMSKFVLCWLHHCTYRSEKQMWIDRNRENLMSSSSQVPKSRGKLVALFQAKNRLNQETVSDREDFPFRHTSTGFGSNEPFFRFSNLVTCIGELQRETYSQRLELADAHFGSEESQREHVRLHEELVMREKAVRDTRIRSIHEMEELRRAQELRVDEFSVQKIERKS